MVTSSTQLSICNDALLRIGAEQIVSLNDGTDRAKLCTAFWTVTVEETLRAAPWNFATERVTLAQAGAPTHGFTYYFSIPADAVRILDIEGEPPYRVEGARILCDTTPINVRYVKKVTDPTAWEAGFVEALTLALAAKLAFPVTGTKETVEVFTSLYQAKLKAARAEDEAEGYAGKHVTTGAVSDSRIVQMAVARVFEFPRGRHAELDPGPQTRSGMPVYAQGLSSVKPEAIRLASLIFERTRNETMRSHPWNFAIKRVASLAYTEPAATLTPGVGALTLATAGVEFTAGSAVFAATDVGKTLDLEDVAGKALVTGFTSTTVVTATITEAFASLDAVASGSWRLYYALPAHAYAYSHPKPSDWLRWLDTEPDDTTEFRVEGQYLVTDDESLDLSYIALVTDPTLWDELFIEALVCHLASKIALPVTGSAGVAGELWKAYVSKLSEARVIDGLESGTPRVVQANDLIDVRF
jgi:hypothetical protein